LNTNKLIITHNDGSTVEVEPCKLSHPCHHGQPCYCGRNQGDKMDNPDEHKGGMAEPNGRMTEDGKTIPEMTPDEARVEHIKAVYYARKVILQYGTPSEKMATSKAM